MQVADLDEVQEEVYSEPTVLLANKVSGEEEIPEGVVAVLTPDAPDVLSHSSVRARNMKVRRPDFLFLLLLALCARRASSRLCWRGSRCMHLIYRKS